MDVAVTIGVVSAPHVSRSLPYRPAIGHPDDMSDRPFPAVEALVRRVQRVAASRPDPARILAETISMAGVAGVDPYADPYAVLGILVEGVARTLVEHIPPERQAETAETLIELLRERLSTHGLPGRRLNTRSSAVAPSRHVIGPRKLTIPPSWPAPSAPGQLPKADLSIASQPVFGVAFSGIAAHLPFPLLRRHRQLRYNHLRVG